MWVCVLGLGFQLRPATPGWRVGLCVCSCAHSACTPQLLAALCGVGECVWARVSAAPRHPWLGCWGVCVCVRSPLVPRHSWLACAMWMCVLGLRSRLRPAFPGWGVGVGVCLCARSACTSPLLAGVCGVGRCAWAWVSAAPRHSLLGCWAVCVFVCPLRLYPATPGWGVRRGCVCLDLGFGCAPPLLAGVLGCVCLCARSACTPPLLAGVCGARVGRCLAPVPVPLFAACCAPCLGLRHPVAVVAWHLSVCLGCGRRRASPACLLGPRRCAAPRPVQSLSVLRSAFPTPWCLFPTQGLAPPVLLGGCAGHVEAGREPGSLCLPLVPTEAGALGSLRVVPVRGPAIGLSLAGPSGVGLGLRALRWFSCVDPVTDASGFPYRPSFDGGLGRCTGAVSCGRRHRPFRLGGRHARLPCVCVCVWSSWPGRAGRPPGRVLVRLTFSCGRPWCALGLFGPLRAWVALFVVVVGVLFSFPCCAPVVSGVQCFPARGALRLGVLWSSAPPPFFFVFFSLVRRLVRGVLWFPARGAIGLGVVSSSRPVPRLAFVCFFLLFSPPSPPRPFFFPALVFCLFAVFFSASAFFFSFFVPVPRCLGWFVCPALWGVLVCVAVARVPWRGPVLACAVSLVAPWSCLFCVCCCLSCGGVVVCFVFCPVLCGVPVLGLVLAPCCCPLLPLPGPLSWPVVVFSPGVRCCVALVVVCRAVWCSLRLVLLVVPCCFVCAGWCMCVVACGCRLFVAGSGCLLLFSAGVCCRGCFCLAARPAALLCSVVCCGAPLPCAVSCVLWCCVAVWCHAVPPCCPFSFAGGVGFCPFPVCAVLCCVACRVVQCRFGLRCCWCLVLCCVAVCCGVSLGALWFAGAPLVCCGHLLCRAVFCGGLSPCGAVPLGCALCCALLPVYLFPLKTIFWFLKIKKK